MEDAIRFSRIDDFLSLPELPGRLRELIVLASDFNTIMQGALIRYNYLIQVSRQSGRQEEIQPAWERYLENMKNYNWKEWDINKLWGYCPYTHMQTKTFVEKWIELVKSGLYTIEKGDELIRDREFRLKGARRSRLYDKSVAQKQQSFTGIGILGDQVNYLTFRWNTVKTFIKDIQEGLAG
jgi:hypothetical protein